MDRDRFKGQWQQLKGRVKRAWGELTDDDLTRINGDRDELEGRLRDRYGYEKDQARAEVDRWSKEQDL